MAEGTRRRGRLRKRMDILYTVSELLKGISNEDEKGLIFSSVYEGGVACVGGEVNEDFSLT